MYAEPIELQDERFGVMFVSRDITKEIEIDRLKTELVATVSHELRTRSHPFLALPNCLNIDTSTKRSANAT